jgi:hydroxylamine oxidation protein HaoB
LATPAALIRAGKAIAMTAGEECLPQPAPAAPADARVRRLLVACGALLLAGAAVVAWRSTAVSAPYVYERAGTVDGTSRERLHVRAADGADVLAEAEVERTAAGPVLAAWRTRVDDPLLYLAPPPLKEIDALADALRKHADALPVLAWWDTSRLLRQRGVSRVEFDAHLRWPSFVPRRWTWQRAAIESAERAYWGEADRGQRDRFARFVAALLDGETEGVRRLHELVGEARSFVLVLHQRDAIGLAQADPGRFGLLMRDVGDVGDVHRTVRSVKDWLAEQGAAAYLVLPGGDGRAARALALADEASASTLAARLLPFIGNRQDDVAGLTLVHRVGGFLVYHGGPQPAAARD